MRRSFSALLDRIRSKRPPRVMVVVRPSHVESPVPRSLDSPQKPTAPRSGGR
jgi:hypothetical protein